MKTEELMMIKQYLEAVTPLNHIGSVEIVAKWEMAYKVVYEALNGIGSYKK